MAHACMRQYCKHWHTAREGESTKRETNAVAAVREDMQGDRNMAVAAVRVMKR